MMYMAIHEIREDRLAAVADTSFEALGMTERQDLQRLLKQNIEPICTDTLLIGEEVSIWEGSHLRIDLLGIDKNANIVVIELKRTQDGGHAELQSIRYAAMISNLTFERAVEIYEGYLKHNPQDENVQDEDTAEHRILDFLAWNDSDEDRFGQDVRILIVAAGFSKELTTTVMWLNNYDLDIQCVRTKPYLYDGTILLDIQTVIPLPELTDYQVKIRDKHRSERVARKKAYRDFTKYNLSIRGNQFERLNKRKLVHALVSKATNEGILPTQLIEATKNTAGHLFRSMEGELNLEEARTELGNLHNRYFVNDDADVHHENGTTYLLSNQWGGETPHEIANAMKRHFPQLRISIRAAQ